MSPADPRLVAGLELLFGHMGNLISYDLDRAAGQVRYVQSKFASGQKIDKIDETLTRQALVDIVELQRKFLVVQDALAALGEQEGAVPTAGGASQNEYVGSPHEG